MERFEKDNPKCEHAKACRAVQAPGGGELLGDESSSEKKPKRKRPPAEVEHVGRSDVKVDDTSPGVLSSIAARILSYTYVTLSIPSSVNSMLCFSTSGTSTVIITLSLR